MSFSYAPLQLRLYAAYIAALPCLTYGAIATLAAHGPWRFGLLAVAVVVGVAAVHRAFRLQLNISVDGIVIKNYWRSYNIGWDQIVEVDIGSLTMGIIPRPAVRFRLTGGGGARAQATPTSADLQKALLDRIRRIAPDEVAIGSSEGS